jgi:hypothetical protein
LASDVANNDLDHASASPQPIQAVDGGTLRAIKSPAEAGPRFIGSRVDPARVVEKQGIDPPARGCVPLPRQGTGEKKPRISAGQSRDSPLTAGA